MRYNNSTFRILITASALSFSIQQAVAQGAQYPMPPAQDGSPGASYPSADQYPAPVPNTDDFPSVGPTAGVSPMPAPIASEPMPARPERVEQYDGVGYASVIGPEYTGGPTASGEPFNPNGYSAGHNQLPVNSFVEVTHLTTGKTILVRINDRVPSGNTTLLSLSPAAAAALGMNGGEATAVRARRVNPPDQEKSALANGQKGADRMNTPEQLLVALRKKLGNSSPVFAAAPAAVAAPVRTARAKPVAPRPAPQPVVHRAGANYEQPVLQPEARPEPSTFEPGSEYIIEDGSRPRPVAQSAGHSGRYFVQLGAFNDRGRAYAFAHRAGAAVVTNGALYRVRKGPYTSENAARSTLGAWASKGYRGAKVTR